MMDLPELNHDTSKLEKSIQMGLFSELKEEDNTNDIIFEERPPFGKLLGAIAKVPKPKEDK